MLPIRKEIFRAYDIRGRAGQDFDQEWARILGQACGTYFRRQNLRAAVLGRDCRRSSPEYAEAVREGLLSCGLDVLDLGMLPSPVFYFAALAMKRQAGVMVTASHNPPEDNGFKIWSGQTTMCRKEIETLHQIMRSGEFSKESGAILCRHDIVPSYLEHLSNSLELSAARPLTVVLDGANGAGGLICAELLRRLGVKTIPINCRPDGDFPNHPPDPNVPENLHELRERVLAEKADLGIGLDGDADRIGVLDEKGRHLSGDRLMAIMAREVLKSRPGATIMADIKCSHLLFEDIKKYGGQAIMCQSGHSLIKRQLMDIKADMAGEISGHIIFGDRYFPFDDAIYAAGRLMEIMSGTEKPLSAMLEDWPITAITPEIRLPCPDELKFQVVERAIKELGNLTKSVTVDGLRLIYPDGWALIRASNTQPLLSMRFEATTAMRLKELRAMIEDRLPAWREREPK